MEDQTPALLFCLWIVQEHEKFADDFGYFQPSVACKQYEYFQHLMLSDISKYQRLFFPCWKILTCLQYFVWKMPYFRKLMCFLNVFHIKRIYIYAFLSVGHIFKVLLYDSILFANGLRIHLLLLFCEAPNETPLPILFIRK